MQTVNPRRVYEARLKAGMSQVDLAHAIRSAGDYRTSEKSVRNWEKGKHTPHADVVPAIAAATGVEIAFLYQDDTAAEDDEEAALARDLAQLPEDLRLRLVRVLERRRGVEAGR